MHVSSGLTPLQYLVWKASLILIQPASLYITQHQFKAERLEKSVATTKRGGSDCVTSSTKPWVLNICVQFTRSRQQGFNRYH